MELKKHIITIYNLWDNIICFFLTIGILLFWFIFLWPNMVEETSLQMMIFLSCVYLPVMPGIFIAVIFDRPLTIVWFNSDEIVFFKLFRKIVRENFSTVILVKKAFFYYMRLYTQVTVKEYLECIEMHFYIAKNNNEKEEVIPYKYLFRGSKTMCKKRLNNLFLLIEKINPSVIESGLIEELRQKTNNYLLNKKIKKKIMYVQSDSSYEIIEK